MMIARAAVALSVLSCFLELNEGNPWLFWRYLCYDCSLQ